MGYRIAATIFVLNSFLFANTQSVASVFDLDDRTASEARWPVGMINNGWAGHGSGFLIDRCRVLTARHVAGRSTVVGKRLTFRMMPWAPKSVENTSGGIVTSAGNPKFGLSEDWALIRLDKCLGAKFGFFPLANSGFYTLGSSTLLRPGLVAMGFPADRGRNTLSIDPSCEAKIRTARGLLHDCATMPGASGGPLLTWSDRRQEFEVVGIIVAGLNNNKPVPYNAQKANVAVDLTVARTGIDTAGR